ncbi:MAG: LPS export ABC transporter permease LptG [Nitrospirota bacterium]
MSLLSRYIASEYLKLLAILLAALVIVFVTIDSLDKVRWYIKYNPSFLSVVEYFLFKLPKIISDLLPFALFLTSLLTLGLLTKNNEIVPMMSAGINIIRITMPILLVGGIVSIMSFFLNGIFVPATYKQSRVIQKEKIEKEGIHGTFLQNKIWLRIDRKTLLYAQLVDAKKNAMFGVHFYMLGEQIPIRSEIEAQSLHHETGRWVLSHGVDIKYDKNGTVFRKSFIRKEIQIEKTLLEMQQMEVNPDEMSYQKLRLYINQLEKDGMDANRYQVDLHRKYAFPFSNFVLAFLGIPIAFKYFNLRQASMAKPILLGLGIVLFYWLSFSITYSMGRLETLSPVVAGWGHHILFLTAGAVLFVNFHRALR